ncbi:MAG: class A beta-lactamase-related serine hydrolase [Lachnospiraceae bacterium]|nr:class A beta-lactamase-related serine hydrolase [Lachnospiraceae bacterium]
MTKKEKILIGALSTVTALTVLSAGALYTHRYFPKGEENEVFSSPEGYVEAAIDEMLYEVDPDSLTKEMSVDFSDLEKNIETTIAENQKLVGGDWSVYVKVLESGDTLSMNQTKMQAASVIKLFVMGAVYEHYEELTEKYPYEDIDALTESMITISDNEATDYLVFLLGSGDYIQGRAVVNEFCRDNGFTNTSMDRMMADDNIYSDNYTTTEDCALMLEKIYNGEFKHSKDMMNYLMHQTRNNKIPAGLPNSVAHANKTGELMDVENDVAIVFAKKPYLLCVMSDGVGDYQIPIDGIVEISEATYEYIRDNT